jgi:hypothetical protein
VESPPADEEYRPDGEEKVDGTRLRTGDKRQYRPHYEGDDGDKERRQDQSLLFGRLTVSERAPILNPSGR